MSDLIRRQDVIDALELGLENDYVDATELLAYVKQLPSAEPEERTAKVKNYQDLFGLGGYGDCSECGAEVNEQYIYCPNCGARLEWE